MNEMFCKVHLRSQEAPVFPGHPWKHKDRGDKEIPTDIK